MSRALTMAGALLSLSMLCACGPSRPANEAKSCTELREGWVALMPVPSARWEEKVMLTPPRGLRIERRVAGKSAGAPPAFCEAELYACDKEGAKNAWTAADLDAALSHPEVRYAVSQGARYGDVSDPGSVLVLTHGKERVEVGKPCPTPAGMCRPVPPPVAHLVEVLTSVYEHHKKLSCGTLPEG